MTIPAGRPTTITTQGEQDVTTKVTAADGLGPEVVFVITDNYALINDGQATVTGTRISRATDGTYTHTITVKGCKSPSPTP